MSSENNVYYLKDFAIEKMPDIIPDDDEDLAELVIAELKNIHGIVPDANTDEGYAAIKASLKILTPLRTSVEKRRKELKSDALAWGKKVDGEARRITALLVEIEDPLKEAKSKVDEVKKKREEERLARLQLKVDSLKAYPETAQGQTPDVIASMIEDLEAIEIEDFYDLSKDAAIVKNKSLDKLVEMYQQALEQELEEHRAAEQHAAEEKRRQEEQARMDAEREELKKEKEKLRIQQEENDKLTAEREKFEREKEEFRKAQEQAELDKKAAEEPEKPEEKLESFAGGTVGFGVHEFDQAGESVVTINVATGEISEEFIGTDSNPDSSEDNKIESLVGGGVEFAADENGLAVEINHIAPQDLSARDSLHFDITLGTVGENEREKRAEDYKPVEKIESLDGEAVETSKDSCVDVSKVERDPIDLIVEIINGMFDAEESRNNEKWLSKYDELRRNEKWLSKYDELRRFVGRGNPSPL